jgi:hypothetical protein
MSCISVNFSQAVGRPRNDVSQHLRGIEEVSANKRKEE